MSAARWLIIGGLLTLGACQTGALGPAQDCSISEGPVVTNAPVGMTCTPQSTISASTASDTLSGN